MSHVIWGEVDFTGNSSSDPKESSSNSVEQHEGDSPGNVRQVLAQVRAGSASRRRANSRSSGRMRRLPKEIQQYLERVSFHDSSSSAESKQRSPGSSGNAPVDLNPTRSRSASSRPRGVALVQAAAAALVDVISPRAASTVLAAPVLGEEDDEEEEEEEEEEADGIAALTAEELGNLNAEERRSIIALMLDSDQDLALGEHGLGEFWSKGSTMHSEGKCRPCHYVHTNQGCNNGKDCEFCHLPHTRKSRPRPCKTKRLQCKRFVSFLEEANSQNPEQFAEAVQKLSSRSSYLRGILRKRLKQRLGHAASSTEGDLAFPAPPPATVPVPAAPAPAPLVPGGPKATPKPAPAPPRQQGAARKPLGLISL